MVGGLTPGHWLVVLVVFILLFGAKKLPEMARSLGQSARVLKTEMKGMQSDDEARAKSAEQPAALPPGAATDPAQPPQAQTQAVQSQAPAADGAGKSDPAR